MSMGINSIIGIKEYFDRHNGLQRSNRYSVTFPSLPQQLELPAVNPNDFQTLAVSMGARAIDAIADNLAGYGPGRLVPRYQKFGGGVLLSFAVTNDNFIISFFDKWFNGIYSGGRTGGFNKPFRLNYYNDIIYGSKMNVNLLDPNGAINKTFTFYEVYPLENIPMELNMVRPNEYLIYQVLMNFREFTIT